MRISFRRNKVNLSLNQQFFEMAQINASMLKASLKNRIIKMLIDYRLTLRMAFCANSFNPNDHSKLKIYSVSYKLLNTASSNTSDFVTVFFVFCKYSPQNTHPSKNSCF